MFLPPEREYVNVEPEYGWSIPKFAENKWVYISYHRPVVVPAANAPAGAALPTAPNAGATTLARGVWDGTQIRNLQDIFQTTATGTESSRIACLRDGMLYMTICGPGTGKTHTLRAVLALADLRPVDAGAAGRLAAAQASGPTGRGRAGAREPDAGGGLLAGSRRSSRSLDRNRTRRAPLNRV